MLELALTVPSSMFDFFWHIRKHRKTMENNAKMVVSWDLMGFTLWCHQTWLAGKSPTEWRFLARNITEKWSIFHCHVWLPEGKWFIDVYSPSSSPFNWWCPFISPVFCQGYYQWIVIGARTWDCCWEIAGETPHEVQFSSVPFFPYGKYALNVQLIVMLHVPPRY